MYLVHAWCNHSSTVEVIYTPAVLNSELKVTAKLCTFFAEEIHIVPFLGAF